MPKPLWVLQSNLDDPARLAQLTEALSSLDLPHRAIPAIPFSDEPPAVEWDGPVLFYGATLFVSRALAAGRWTPCAFFDPQLFRVSSALRAHGPNMLNAGAAATTLGAFAAAAHDPEALFFVRPDRDLKAFAGEVVRFGDVARWMDRITGGGHLVELAEPIVVAEPVNILAEWRLFVVEGRVSSASRYREGTRLSISPVVPADVVAFGEERAAAWAPAPVFVLDVARTAEGLRVVEVNCFNSAGLYAADVRRVLDDVSRYAERAFSTS